MPYSYWKRAFDSYATDEIVPNYFNFNRAPTHVLGLRKEDTKLGVYEKWVPPTSDIIPGSIEREFCDYFTTDRQLELDSMPDDPRTYDRERTWLNEIVPNELQELLTPPLRAEQALSKKAHLLYRELIALNRRKPGRMGV